MRPLSGMTMAAMSVLLPVGTQSAEAAAPAPKPAAAARAEVAADFLEYLAALEGEEENWTDFEAVEDEPPAVQAKPAAPGTQKTDDSR